MMNILHAILVCVSFQYGKSLYLRKISNTDIEVKNLTGLTYEMKGKNRKISSTVLESIKNYLL